MKLSDLIFESQILLEDTFEIRKNPNGRTWGVYNTTVTPNVLISSHKTKNQARIKLDQLKNPTAAPANKTSKPSKADRNKSKTPKPNPVVNPNVKLTSGMYQSGTNRWTMIMPDGKTMVDIDDELDAKRFQNYVQKLEKQNKTPADITKMFTEKRTGFLADADVKNADKVGQPKAGKINRTIRSVQMKDFIKEMEARQSISKFANSPVVKWTLTPPFAFFKRIVSSKIGGLAGNTLAMFAGVSMAISDIEGELETAQGEERDKLLEEVNILRGQAIIQFGIFLTLMLKNLKSVRKLIRPVKVLVQTAMTWAGLVAGGVTAGPLGAVAGAKGGRIASILVSEGLSLAFLVVLTLPQVQRFIAQLLQNYLLGDVFGYIGAALGGLLDQANEALDGKYGTGFLADKLTVDEEIKKGPSGEYYSDSEWAKLVFGALLFPEDEKTKFVPYMPEAKREDMMEKVLGIDLQAQDPDATDPRGKDQIPPAPGPQTEPSVNSGAPGFRPGQ